MSKELSLEEWLEQTEPRRAEIEAYADSSYCELLKGLQSAVEKEETLRWSLISAQARIDVWRSLEASNRTMDRATL